MKKYKLIKWYPGIKEIYKTQELIIEKSDAMWYQIKEISLYFAAPSVENNPEFWQEVEEKLFTIMELQTCANIWKLADDGKYFSALTKFTLNHLLYEDATITKVRNESNGEILSVGDTVRFNYHGSIQTRTIKNFLVDGCINTEIATLSKEIWKPEYNLRKLKTPLLITDDGVEIFNPTQYIYLVNRKTFVKLSTTASYSFLKENFVYSTIPAQQEGFLKNFILHALDGSTTNPVQIVYLASRIGQSSCNAYYAKKNNVTNVYLSQELRDDFLMLNTPKFSFHDLRKVFAAKTLKDIKLAYKGLLVSKGVDSKFIPNN